MAEDLPTPRPEEALHESEERLRIASAAAQLGVFEWRVTTDEPFWENDRMYEIFGRTREEGPLSLAEFYADVIEPQDQPDFDRALTEAMRPESSFHAVCRIRRGNDGEQRWLELSGRFDVSADGSPHRLIGVVADITGRKRSEEALRESEHRFRWALRGAGGGAWDWDLGSGSAWWSPEMYELWGVEPGAPMETENSLNMILDDDRERVVRAVEESVSRPTDYRCDFRIRHPSRGERWMTSYGRPICNEEGHPERLLGITFDITERKRAEEALRQSREDLDRAQQVGQIGSWRLDVRRNILTWSDENHRIFGVPKGTELTYETFLSIVHPDDREFVDTRWNAGLRGDPYDIEHRIVVDERVKWVREKAFLEFDDAGSLLGGFGITQDITDRKRAEEALRESESFHRQILESIPGMVFTTRPDGYCDYQSQQWVDYSGIPLREHLGDGWKKLLHPDDQPRTIAAWRAAVEGRAPYDLEYRVRRHDGAYEWFKVIGRPIRDGSGRIVRWFGVALNIEDLKQADEALQSSLREKVVLLREVHHRVKNNLQVVSSLVSLQADALGDPGLNRVFEDVRDRVRTMALVHEELYQSDNLAEVALDSYAANLLRNLWRAHGDAASRVKLEMALEPITLTVEQAVPCGLILNELASNALKHGFPGDRRGTVVVTLEAVDPGGFCLAVRDDGVGLPADMDWRNTPTLGLKLVQLLARQLSATVSVDLDSGTSVTLRV
jgi:PAS domain S-box-containing protein